jgi:hypothetical protein
MNRQSPSSLYDADIVTWADTQAELLRALSQRPDLSNAVDWENVIEEIETVGRTETRVITSAIRQIFIHLIKCWAEPDSPASRHWRAELVMFHATILADYTASMAQKIDLNAIWKLSSREAQKSLDVYDVPLPGGIPQICPYTLLEIIAQNPNFEELIARLPKPEQNT